MAIPQTKFREIVFLLLYSHDFAQNDKEGFIERVMIELRVTKKSVYEAFAKVEAIWEVQAQIDEKIDKVTDEYAFNRITRVELNALRLGLFEIQYEKKIPLEVAFSEAIRISKKFGSPEGANFVNALLDALCRKEKV